MFKFKKHQAEVFQNGIKGTLLDLSDVPDKMFAQRLLGDGYAIKPVHGAVYAPLSGTITVAFPTGHAYGIETDSGLEILIHVGIDTVELKGEGFTSYVTQGDRIKQGDLLCRVDLDVLLKHDTSSITPVILTSGESVSLTQLGELIEVGATDFIDIQKA